MELYLFRHGIATDAPPGTPDSARELTPEGREKVAAVAKRARRAGADPSLIVSSPYLRAVQTARIAARELGYSGTILETKALVPFGTPAGVWEELRDYAGQSSILLAGHEPLLSQLAAYLLGAPELRVEMKKATMVRIDLEIRGRLPGTLRWMLTAGLAS
jgi:phosphohistidine phosphatase